MRLSECLEYCAKEFLDDRTDLVEGDEDSLWSDAYLIRQMNEAQRVLCRRAWVIIEYGKSPAGVITLQTGRTLYPIHDSILRVFDATPITQAYPLGRTNDADLRDVSQGGLDAYETGELAALSATALTGAPLAFASDAASRSIRVHPTPTTDQNGLRVALKIARMPLVMLTVDDLDAEPEVPEEWHMAICEFAAGKALTLPNVDGEQKAEGRRILAEFDDAVRLARQERQRAEMDTGRWGFNSATATLGSS